MEQNNESADIPEKSYDFHLHSQVYDLYLSNEISDVKFVFINKETNEKIATIPAHKFVLIMASDQFRKLFNGSWKEKNEVEIVDSSPAAFKEFLQCFYLNNGTFTFENISDVMNLANKYQVSGCIDACAHFLMDCLTPTNICFGYGLAALHEHQNLKEFCEDQIKNNVSTVLKSDYFLNCDRKMLADILKLNLYSDEVTIFNGCLSWAKLACKNNDLDENIMENLQNQLGECLYLIRFGLMTMEEFANISIKHRGLFPVEDLEEIIYCISVKGFQSEKFCQKMRLSWYENKIWVCKSSGDEMYPCIFSYAAEGTKSAQITSNKTTLLGGLSCEIFDKSNYSTQLDSCDIHLSIIENPGQAIFSNDGKLLLSEKFKLDNNGYIKLSTPILITKEVTYKFHLKFESNRKTRSNITMVNCKQVTSPNGLEINFKSKNENSHHWIACLLLMDI